MPTKTPRPPQADAHAATAVLQVAERLHAMEPEWVVFFREVLGVEGIVRRCLTIRGLHNYGPDDLIAAVDFLERHHGRYPFAELVSAWFPLSDTTGAFTAAADPACIRVGVRP